jgi:iron-sulfur cluster assembly protein
MITLTTEALSKLRSILSERDENTHLRIAVVSTGRSGFQYRMILDKEAGVEDKIIELKGLKVVIDEKSSIYLNGTKVDYVEAKDGAGFTFDNPNAKASCGYGETFEA